VYCQVVVEVPAQRVHLDRADFELYQLYLQSGSVSVVGQFGKLPLGQVLNSSYDA
jgi:hypothetical protein